MIDPYEEIEQLKQRIAILKTALTQANRVQIQWQLASEQLSETQLSLKESRDRFLALYEHATNGMLVANTAGEIQTMNPEALRIFGFTEDHIPVHLCHILPDYEALMKQSNTHQRERKYTSLIFRKDEASMLRRDGSTITASLSLISISIAGGELLLLSVQDISTQVAERLQYESDRVILEREVSTRSTRLLKLSRALEAAVEPIVIVDTTGTIEYANPAYFNMWGYVPSDVLGNKTSMIKSGQHDDAFYATLWQKIMKGNLWEGKLINQCCDGQLKSINLSISPIFDEQNTIINFVGIYRDLTQQEHIAKQIAQSQKMEAVSTLVGGISHEFNNILAGMTGNLYLAKMLYPNDPDMNKYLGNAEDQGFKAAEMIQKLMIFARKDWVEEKELDLNALIKEFDALGCFSIPKNIRFNINLHHQPLLVRADTTQIQQILLHLVQNAHDALAHASHGQITIQLDRWAATASFLAEHTENSARHYAKIMVRDNGIGIREKDLPHIFEPFYSSKDTGDGTGLGLAAVFGAVERLGGTMDVQSQPGDTCFSLYIPIVAEQNAVGHSTPVTDDVPATKQKQKILLVDDEVEVLAITSKILRSLHYDVVEAHDGLEAMLYYEKHSDMIDLVVSDMIMPEMSGVDAVARMRQIRENLPVVFMTGYDQEYFEQQVKERDNTRLILKPLRVGELAKMIREMLHH